MRALPGAAAFSLLRPVGHLPYPVRYALGRRLGGLLHGAMARRRRIAAANLALCFPDLDPTRRAELVAEHFRRLGVALVETAAAWFGPVARLSPLRSVEGLEHLTAALAGGRGALVVSAHFVGLEMGLCLLAGKQPGYAVYRPHNNPIVDRWIRRGRGRFARALLDRGDVRGIVRALKAGGALWFPPDQDHGPRHGVFAEFFGQPAATVTTPARIARMAGCAVVPAYTFGPAADGYDLRILPPLDGFPSGDDAADARRLNAILEAQIRAHVADYLWVHRRFKTRPEGAPPVYAERRR